METSFNEEKNRIGELLESYFNGETTLEQEKTLRKYFSSSYVDNEFKQYAPLFNYFSQEKEMMEGPIKENNFKKFFSSKTSKKMFYRSFSLSVAAALVIFAYILWPVQQEGVVFMVGGERIDNEQLAISKTDRQLGKISTMMGLIEKNSNSLNKLNTIEKSLAIINKK